MAISRQLNAIPLPTEQFVIPDGPDAGMLSPVWHQFLVHLWGMLGGSGPISSRAIMSDSVGLAPVPQTLGASPLVFVAAAFGWLVVSRDYQVVPATGDRKLGAEDCTVELSRDGGGSWTLLGIGTVTVPLMRSDRARVSWASRKPLVTWLQALPG